MKRFFSDLFGRIIYGLLFIIFGAGFLFVDMYGLYYSVQYLNDHTTHRFTYLIIWLAVHSIISLIAQHVHRNDFVDYGLAYKLASFFFTLPVVFTPIVSKAIARQIPISNAILPLGDQKYASSRPLSERIHDGAVIIASDILFYTTFGLMFIVFFAIDAGIFVALTRILANSPFKMYAYIAYGIPHVFAGIYVCIKYNWGNKLLYFSSLVRGVVTSIAGIAGAIPIIGLIFFIVIMLPFAILIGFACGILAFFVLIGIISVFSVPLLFVPDIIWKIFHRDIFNRL